VATPLLDKPEIVAVSHLGETRAWSTTCQAEGPVRTNVGGHLARLMNPDHSILR
jgi:hypothetical protein